MKTTLSILSFILAVGLLLVAGVDTESRAPCGSDDVRILSTTGTYWRLNDLNAVALEFLAAKGVKHSPEAVRTVVITAGVRTNNMCYFLYGTNMLAPFTVVWIGHDGSVSDFRHYQSSQGDLPGVEEIEQQMRRSPRVDWSEPAEADTLSSMTYSVRGRGFELVLSEQRLRATPSWETARTEEPSVLPGRAISLARHALQQEFADASGWMLDVVRLESYPLLDGAADRGPGADNTWYYLISFRPPESKRRDDEDFRVYVLMDGTVVAPHRRELEIRRYE